MRQLSAFAQHHSMQRGRHAHARFHRLPDVAVVNAIGANNRLLIVFKCASEEVKPQAIERIISTTQFAALHNA